MPPELEQQEQSSPMDQVLQHVAAEVLETMFFTEAELADCEHGWLAEGSAARVGFEGSHFGEMLFGVSAEAVDPIAASFLGLDPEELTDAQRGQVIQFDPLARLAARADAVYRVKVRGLKAGDWRFKVLMMSDQLQVPVREDESTTVYDDENN